MAVGNRDGSLPPDLRRIAEEELGETDERRREALKKLSYLLEGKLPGEADIVLLRATKKSGERHRLSR